jgi:hypothetical protein
VNEKYTGDSIREHILKMNTTASKLKEINLKEDDFLIHLIFTSLPKEEKRIKSSQGESAHFVKDYKRKNFNGKNSKPQGKPKWDKVSSSNLYGKKP